MIPAPTRISRKDMEAILDVTTALATPVDMRTMLEEVVNAAKQVLNAERASVWLYDPDANQLVLEVATSLQSVRVPADHGLVGSCAQTREIINVPDCYADPRFNRDVDKATGYRTRCMLTLPLIARKNVLVGVMQVLNKIDGVFGAGDEDVAASLAAQCAVALQRVQRTAAVIEAEKRRQSLANARAVQANAVPTAVPAVDGYDVHATFRPAGYSGASAYDVSLTNQGLLLVLGDANGQGIAPAFSVSQLQAMMRMAFLLGADLDNAFRQVNDQMARTMPDGPFITAFIGLLDPATHLLRFHSAGTRKTLHFQAARDTFGRYLETSLPLGEMPIVKPRPPIEMEFEPHDILVLLSDGFYQHTNADGEEFGEARVRDIVAANRNLAMADLTVLLLSALDAFAGGIPQDGITAVLLKRTGV